MNFDKERVIRTVPFSDLFEAFITYFIKEYGELLLKEIALKVATSKKATKFIAETSYRRALPGTDDYVIVIHSSSHFTFSKAEVICCASILLLNRWNKEVGVPLGLANRHYLNTVFFGIIKKADKFKTHTSASSNFFERFLEYLNTSTSLTQRTPVKFEELIKKLIKKGYTLDRQNDPDGAVFLSPEGFNQILLYNKDHNVVIVRLSSILDSMVKAEKKINIQECLIYFDNSNEGETTFIVSGPMEEMEDYQIADLCFDLDR